MKIKELNLIAFGPFTDRTLGFDQSGEGLQVIFGPNEAGKSSALRGLKALLYGVEERTTDNFIHANEKLRIGGCLQSSSGQELHFIRRKGRKNTLLTYSGEALDEQVLDPFLSGVTAEVFETLFGIDRRALVQGGREILEQKGEVGQALFSASLGSHALHAVLGELDAEADALFRPQGVKQKINAALKSYTQLKKDLRACSLSSRVWDEHHHQLHKTARELQQVQTSLADKRAKINRLQRIQRVMPKLTRRNELLQERTVFADVVILSEDFRERRHRAVKRLETEQAILAKATPRLRGLQQQLEELSFKQELLEQEENIEDLHARLGSYRKAMQDRPHFEAQRQLLLADAQYLLKEIHPGLKLSDVEQLRPVMAKRQAIMNLGNQHEGLKSRLEQITTRRAETEIRQKIALKERDDLPATGALGTFQSCINAARKLGDLDTAIQSLETERCLLEDDCIAGISRLKLWQGKMEALPGLAVPNRGAIIRYEEEYLELEKRIRHYRDKREQFAEVLQESLQRLDEIQRLGTVPTETALIKLRSERDRLWQLLRRQYMEGEDISIETNLLGAEESLPELFEGRLVAADELSDRLRREADRVHALASLQAKQEAMQRQVKEIDQQLRDCQAEQSRLSSEWQGLWSTCEIQPRSPREMRVWLEDLETLRERVVQEHRLQHRVTELKQTRNTHIAALNQQLHTLGRETLLSDSLETVLLECEGILQYFDEIRQKRNTLNKEIRSLESSLYAMKDEYHQAGQDLSSWKTQWRESIQDLGLQETASVTEVADTIERLGRLFEKLGEAEKLLRGIKSIDDDAELFRKQVLDIMTKTAADVVGLPADEAAIRLNALLSQNRSRRVQRYQIESQLEQARQEIQGAEASMQSMIQRLDSLCEEAKCAKHSELDQAEYQSARHQQINREIASVEQEILEMGGGATIEALEMEAKGIDPDLLPGQIELLSNAIEEELEPKRTKLAEAKGREEKELELMDGGNHAALLAEEAQVTLAGIRADAERYVLVKLASRILRAEIERYRVENQGPLLKRASEHFTALTRRSFEGLITDYNEKDEPVVVGVRRGGKRVYVQGMSAGTRDQLYLALRLASLEKYMQSAEPMPFIVDDILVDFDDERSQAALNALAKLAEKTQVIVFTHHSQVVEHSNLPAKARAQIHEL